MRSTDPSGLTKKAMPLLAKMLRKKNKRSITAAHLPVIALA
jgi:hypothetical protein